MRFLQNWGEFSDIVGMINSRKILASFGLVPCSPTGLFDEDRLQELQEVCKNIPDLHIISYLPSMMMNKYHPDADFYFIGIGDANPNIIFLQSFDNNFLPWDMTSDL